MKRVLFILRDRNKSCGGYYGSPGLENSAEFVLEILEAAGFVAKLVHVVDGNGIDREVHEFKPDVVILEAIWCPPSKLAELVKLYGSRVQWVVRVHSDIPFLALEGMAVEWLRSYEGIEGVQVAVNKVQAGVALGAIEISSVVLENYYPTSFEAIIPRTDTFRVGCFGAIRPLKNQLFQALAAKAASKIFDRPLKFFINGLRVEFCGEGVLKNLKAALGDSLVVVPWLDRPAFLGLLRTMDLSLAISLSETFNIVVADSLKVGVPVLVGEDIGWVDKIARVPSVDFEAAVEGIYRVLGPKRDEILDRVREDLVAYSGKSKKQWEGFLNG